MYTMPTECARAGRAVNKCKETVGQGPPTKRRPAGVIENPCSRQAKRLAKCTEGTRPRLSGGKGKRGGVPVKGASKKGAPGVNMPKKAPAAKPARLPATTNEQMVQLKADYGGHSVTALNAHLEGMEKGLSKGGGNKLAKLSKIRMNRGLSTLAKKPPKA